LAGAGQSDPGVDQLIVSPHLSFAEQRQRDIGQVGEIAGAERAKLTREWRQAGVQRAYQDIEQLTRDAGAACADLIGPRRHRGAHQMHRQRTAGAARVTAQEAERVLLAVVLGHPIGP
jgi:hypothetical protein